MTNKINQIQLSSTVALGAKVEGAQRAFQTVAYTGKMVETWFGRLSIDLDGVVLRSGVPALTDHDPALRTGVGNLSRGDSGIHFDGVLLRNDNGKAVADDSDDGFPFQMSIGVEATKVERIDRGETAEVNGAELEGPAVIYRKSHIYEVSFLSLGADDDTSSTILNRQTNEDNDMELQEQLDAEKAKSASLATELETMRTQLADINKKRLDDRRDALLTQLGKAEDADWKSKLSELDDKGLDAVESTIALFGKQSGGLSDEFFQGQRAPVEGDGGTADANSNDFLASGIKGDQ